MNEVEQLPVNKKDMQKKDPSNTGGRALLNKHGPKYFKKLAERRWAKVPAKKESR